MTDDELRALLDGSCSAVDYGRAVENAAYERAAKALAEADMLDRNAAEAIRCLIVPRVPPLTRGSDALNYSSGRTAYDTDQPNVYDAIKPVSDK